MANEEDVEFARLPPPLKRRALDWVRIEQEREQAQLAVADISLPRDVWRLIANELKYDASSLRALDNTSASIHKALLPLDETLDKTCVRIPWLRRLLYRLHAQQKKAGVNCDAYFSQTELASPRNRYVFLIYRYESLSAGPCVKICKYSGLIYSQSDLPIGEITMKEPERLFHETGQVSVNAAVDLYSKKVWREAIKPRLALIHKEMTERQKNLKTLVDPQAAVSMRFLWTATPFDRANVQK